MDFYKALYEAVGEDGMRRLGVTPTGGLVSSFKQSKLIEMSLAADALMDAGIPDPAGKNLIPAWAVTHLGDEPDLREVAEVKAPVKVLMALVGNSGEDLGDARKRLARMIRDVNSMKSRGVKDPVGYITSKFTDAIPAADKKTIADYLKSMIESDAEDAGIELGIDEQDGTMVPAALFNGKVYYWTGDGFSEDRGEGMAFTDADDADAELAKVEKFISDQMEEDVGATDFRAILAEKGNPWHNHQTGKFSNKDALNRAAKGSLSLKSLPQSKQKVAGSGKLGPKMVKAPNLCGRTAREQGLNIRCWTGTPYPDGFGKTPKNLTSKGMKTKNPGAGRGWRKGQSDRAVGRKMRGEWVDVDAGDVLFELDLIESDVASWSLTIADKGAVVQQAGDGDFVWEAYHIDGGGEVQVIATGDAGTVEEAWSDAAVGMGLRFSEASMERSLGEESGMGSKKITVIGSRGDLESIQAEFDGEATFKMGGGTMVIKADAGTLRRIKRYAENNLGVDIREADAGSRLSVGSRVKFTKAINQKVLGAENGPVTGRVTNVTKKEATVVVKYAGGTGEKEYRVRTSDIEEAECGCKAGPRWRKNTRAPIERMRSLGV
jgi:hypothetical protein